MHAVNHQFRLAARPVGLPKDSDWQLTEEPVADPAMSKLVGASTTAEKQTPYDGKTQGFQKSLGQAATDIDTLYRTHELASSYWQEKPETRKKLLQLVRRIVHPLGLPDWKALSSHIDHYAIGRYAQP